MTYKSEMMQLAKLAIPVALSHMLTALAGFVDTVMAGHAGVSDLAGVAVGSAMWLTLMIAPMGLFAAVSPIVGQYAGAERYQAIRNFMHQAARVLIVVILILWAILGLRDLYLPIIMDDPAVRTVTSDYLQGIIWGVPALMATFLLRPYSEGLSFTRPDMMASIVALAVNIPANYALIFGHWGMPALGGAGAGWATAIAFWSALLVMLSYTLRHRVYARVKLWSQWQKLERHEVQHLLKVGAPIALLMFVEVSIFSLIALFLGSRPATEIAAHQVAMNVAYLAFTLPLSISIAATIRVSGFVGRSDPAQAALSARAAMLLALFTALFNISMLTSFAQPIAAIYSESAEVVELAAYLLWFAAMFQLADVLVVPSQGALRGYKDTVIPLWLAILAYWVIALPLGYLLGLTDVIVPAMGAEGFWISLVVGLVISGLLLSSRLYRVTRHYCEQSV